MKIVFEASYFRRGTDEYIICADISRGKTEFKSTWVNFYLSSKDGKQQSRLTLCLSDEDRDAFIKALKTT